MTHVPKAARAALAMLIAVMLGGLIVVGPSLIALVAPGALAVMVLIAVVTSLTRWPDDAGARQRVMWWTFVIFVSHLLLGLIVTHFPSPFNFLRSDSGTYHRGARALVDYWAGDGPMPRLAGGKEGFYYTLGALYRVFGPHTAAGLVFNAAAVAAVAPLLSDLTHRVWGCRAARYVGPLVGLMPGIVMWTSPLLKEAGVVLFVALAANCAARLVERLTPGALLGLATAIGVLFTYRGPVAIVAAGAILMGIVMAPGRLIGGLGTGMSAAAVVAAVVLAMGLGVSGYRAALDNSNFEQVSVVRSDLATTARSGFDAEADVSTATRALSYLPKGLFNFTFGPLPWQIRSFAQAMALPDVAVWWYCVPKLFTGIRVSWRRVGRRTLILALPALLVSTVLALVVSNFGLLVRERVQVITLLIPFIALGFAEREERRQRTSAPTETVALQAVRSAG